MQKFDKMSLAELDKMLADTKAEIVRRGYIDKATSDIIAILDKYNLNIRDIDFFKLDKLKGPTTKKLLKKRASKNTADRRSTVRPKYRNPHSTESWSGRGRTPAWVAQICADENITIQKFKTDGRFKATS